MAATGTRRPLVVRTEWGADEAQVTADRNPVDGVWAVVLIPDINVTFPSHSRVRMSPVEARALSAALLLAAADAEKASL